MMNRNQRMILVLALVVPLLSYGVPYAYATITSSAYTVKVQGTVFAGSFSDLSFVASCNSGDYATGGGVLTGTSTSSSVSVDTSMHIQASTPAKGDKPAQPNDRPDGWYGVVFNSDSSDHQFELFAVCQTPVTVAGIAVPEFSSLYVAIALAALVYFMLARHFTRRPSTVSAQMKA
jgi:hypothetical protein